MMDRIAASLHVAWLYFRIGSMNEMQYRVNFFVQLLKSVITLGTGLISLWVVFLHTGRLNGWSPYQLLVVMGVYTLTGGVISTIIQPNMERLMGEIEDGTFDYALTKPVDAQLMVSVREVRVWNMVDVLSGALVIAYAVLQLKGHNGIWQVLAFLLVLVLGALMIYSFWLILTSMAFWVVRMENIINLFQGVYAAGRYPVGIYPAWLKLGLTFLVPVAFAVTVPSEALTQRLSGQSVLGAMGLTVVLLTVARVTWRFGLRRYSGASA